MAAKGESWSKTVVGGVTVVIVGAAIVASATAIVDVATVTTTVTTLQRAQEENAKTHRRQAREMRGIRDRLIRQETYLEGLADKFGTAKPED